MNHPSPASDAGEIQIIARVARGDREAFAQLYDLYSPRVYGLIITLLRRHGPEADDVLQDIMFELWRSAPKYNPDAGSPTTWILLITRSRTIDHLRKLRSAAGAIGHLTAHSSPAASSDPSKSPRFEPDAVDALLEHIPAEQAQAFRLAFAHGMTREQIAASLDLPVGTVKTRVRSALRRLSELAGTRPVPTDPTPGGGDA